MKKHNLNTDRRNFLKGGLMVGGLGVLNPLSLFASSNKENNAAFELVVGPYLQSDFGNKMTVLWITNKDAASWVEYGVDANQLTEKAFEESSMGFKTAGRINRVVLHNLIPGQKYYYRIVSKEIEDFQPYKLTYGTEIKGQTEQFTNLDSAQKEVSFVMLNDTHDRPESIPHLLGLDKDNQRDFIFFNGDVFNYQTDEAQIVSNMLQPVVNLFAKSVPFVYVRGNHETRGKFAREFPQYFHEVGYEAFTLGPARFVILDTGEDKEDEHPVYAGIVDFDQYRVQQAALLEKEINSPAFKKATFRIVMMHIPPRYAGDWHGSAHCRDLFEPLMNKGKVDLVLSGHTHQYRVHPPAKGLNSYPIIIGGGPKDGNRTLTRVHVTQRQIQVSMIDDSGKEVGAYTVNK